MIPRSIRLSGFLCYREEQRIDFAGQSTLWMLSGLNGSGKSAIFDALTFSLFGVHRGGSLQAQELINKDSDSLAVDFEFSLDGQNYRARRTQKRDGKGGSKGTQQILRTANKEWVAVEGTQYREQFKEWIRENIGLTYETFTSSVLLLQGRAEKLLDSTPAGRRDVLAGIVDLERYEQLSKKADDEKKAREERKRGLENQLAGLAQVDPLEVVEVTQRCVVAEEARTSARERVEQYQRVEMQAIAWNELRDRLERARQRCGQAELLIKDRETIERDVARLAELRANSPHVQAIVEQRSTIQQSEQRSRTWIKNQEKLRQEMAQCEHAIEQARNKSQSHLKVIANDERRHAVVLARLPQLIAFLEKLKDSERQERDLAKVREELSQLPADPAEAVIRARATVDRLTQIAVAIPVLSRFDSYRHELRDAEVFEQSTTKQLSQLRDKGEALKKELENEKEKQKLATEQARAANDEMTQAKTLRAQAQLALSELSRLDGMTACNACGQPLTPAHIEEERSRRSTAVTACMSRERQAQKLSEDARAAEQQLAQHVQQLEKMLIDARLEYGEMNGKAKQAKTDRARLSEDCRKCFQELSPEYQNQITNGTQSDWTRTAYPTERQLTALKAEAAGLTTARTEVTKAEATEKRWTTLKITESSILTLLNRLKTELPNNTNTLREEHAQLEAEKESLQKGIQVRRLQLKEVDADLDRLGKERDAIHKNQVVAEGEVRTEERVRQEAQLSLNRAKKSLTVDWQELALKAGTQELFLWQGECDALEKADTDGRGQSLRQALIHHGEIRNSIMEMEKQQEDYAAEARTSPEAVRVLLKEGAPGCNSARGRAWSGARSSGAARGLTSLTQEHRSRTQGG